MNPDTYGRHNFTEPFRPDLPPMMSFRAALVRGLVVRQRIHRYNGQIAGILTGSDYCPTGQHRAAS